MIRNMINLGMMIGIAAIILAVGWPHVASTYNECVDPVHYSDTAHEKMTALIEGKPHRYFEPKLLCGIEVTMPVIIMIFVAGAFYVLMTIIINRRPRHY